MLTNNALVCNISKLARKYSHNNDRYADLSRVLKDLLVMCGIAGCATRWVELAGTEGRSDGYDRNDRILDSLWGIFRHGLVVSNCKTGPEEEVHVVNVVDAVCQSLGLVRPELTVVTGDLQKRWPWLHQ